jgi:hypothetical protein
LSVTPATQLSLLDNLSGNAIVIQCDGPRDFFQVEVAVDGVSSLFVFAAFDNSRKFKNHQIETSPSALTHEFANAGNASDK